MVTTALNAKATDIESKISDITNLATKAALKTKTAKIKSKLTDITKLTTKTALNTKAREIENIISATSGFITIPEFNRLTKTRFNARLKEAMKSHASKSQVDNALGLAD